MPDAPGPFRTIIEPFRIHSVEPLADDDARPARAGRSPRPGYNLFNLAAPRTSSSTC